MGRVAGLGRVYGNVGVSAAGRRGRVGRLLAPAVLALAGWLAAACDAD